MPEPLLTLAGRTLLVVGAGQGMGAATCALAARAGARIAALDFDATRAADVARSVVAAGGEARPFTANVLDEEQFRATIAEVDEHFGGIDGLVTIVGGSTWVPIIDMDIADWDHDQRLNLRYFLVAAQSVARAAVRRGRPAAIVGISSIDGVRSAPWHAAYGAAKAGLINLVKSMAIEWAEYGIRVNGVAPGVTVHPRRPLGAPEDERALVDGVPLARRGLPEDIAGAAVFLVSDLARMVTGHNLAVDGGYLGIGPIDHRRFVTPGIKRTAWRETEIHPEIPAESTVA